MHSGSMAYKDLDRASRFPSLPKGRVIYMMDPEFFTIVQAINPHMKSSSGQLNTIDRVRARKQWTALKDVYSSLGFTVEVLTPSEDCADMVFCANQTFPFLSEEGTPSVILSNMANDLRQREVQGLRDQLLTKGVECHALPERNASTFFEGMGDALWVPGRRLICGGYGIRTGKDIYREVEAMTETPVVLFELRNPKFYHLDTCLSILSDSAVLACREGFTAEGWETLLHLFETVIEVPLDEADSPGFACNAHSPDGKNVILQRGNLRTNRELREKGFIPIEVDTDEFIKSGGSVFCMKLQTLWS